MLNDKPYPLLDSTRERIYSGLQGKIVIFRAWRQRKRPELLFYTGSRGERVCVKEFIFVAVGQRDTGIKG